MPGHQSLKIVHIAEADGGGGAMQAAFKLHGALKKKGVMSSMLVGRKLTSDPDVHEIPSNTKVLNVLTQKLHRHLEKYRLNRYSRQAGAFTTERGVRGGELIDHLPNADVYNLHWFRDALDYRTFFKRVGALKPVAWRMPDMNVMTGGCHYSYNCERFSTTCGCCPLLNSHHNNDLSSQILRRKQLVFNSLDPRLVRFIAPSRWLKGKAETSKLLRRFETVHIATGVDCHVFKPRPQSRAREVLGLPAQGTVILFAAESIYAYRKGFDLLQAAVEEFRDDSSITLAALGSKPSDTLLPTDTIALGRLEGGELLSMAYSASDVFVLPSRADNLPNVVLEAMACGLPVVAFDVGGVSDLVRSGVTGLLVDSQNVRQLREAISKLIQDAELRRHLSENSREIVLRNFEMGRQTQKYLNVYSELSEAAMNLDKKNAKQ